MGRVQEGTIAKRTRGLIGTCVVAGLEIWNVEHRTPNGDTGRTLTNQTKMTKATTMTKDNDDKRRQEALT